MGNDDRSDEWNGFDWATWGASPDREPDGESTDGADSGAPAQPARREEPDHYSDGFLRPALADVDESSTPSGADPTGRWVTHGGVLAWQPPDGADEESENGDAPLRDEARSSWADDAIALPLAAPPSARVRAVRAWLGLRRLREAELMGELLLERRRLAGPADGESAEGEQTLPPPENPNDPLTLALTEAQAAADEYETLLGLLEETRAHVGVQAALVEFYLAVTDRLAALASHPAAPDDFAERVLYAQVERQPANGELTPALRSEWEGRAGAALATRKRMEQVTAVEPEDD